MAQEDNTPSWRTIHVKQSSHWASNIDELKKRDKPLAERVEASVSLLDQVEVCELGPGQYSCRWAGSTEEIYPPGPLLSKLKTQLDRAKAFYQRGVNLLIIAGSGLGYLAAHIEPIIKDQYQFGVLVVEPRVELFAAQLCLFEARHVIRSYQVYFAVGGPLVSRVESTMHQNALMLVSSDKIALVQERQLSDQENQAIREVRSKLSSWQRNAAARINQAQQAFNQRMQLPPDFETGVAWAFAAPDAYAHTPLIESLLGGFESIGWRKSVIIVRDGFQTRAQVGEDILKQQPDIYFFCNGASGEFVSCETPRPRVTIMLDHPEHYSPGSLQNKLSRLDHVFYADRSYGPFFETTQAGSSQFIPAYPMNTKVGAVRDDLAAPIVFVGSYTPIEDYLKDVNTAVREEIESVAQYKIDHPTEMGQAAIQQSGVSEEAAAVLQLQAQAFIETIQRSFESENAKLDYFLYALSNSLKRERCIGALADLGIVIYGPESWLHVLGEIRAHQYRGWLPSDGAHDVYASASLSLNLHSLQCPTCLNARDFEILAARGCLVSDDIADMNEGLLEPGRDLALFRTPKELRQLVQELLEDPDKRNQLIEDGHKTYRENHTPAHRARSILDAIKSHVE